MECVSDCIAAPELSLSSITAEPIPIRWSPDLPVFAKEEFLKAVGDEYGWLGGLDQHGTLRCILPYTIVQKLGVRLVRFRVETIACGGALDIAEEKSFLNAAVEHFRKMRADVIIPASNNTLFRTFPNGAAAAPYGSYVIDLQQPEDVLWRNISKGSRHNINVAKKDGVTIREGMEFLDPAYDLIRETFRRSKLDFMDRDAFRRLALALGDNGKILRAERQNVAHSYAFFAFSTPGAYWMYGGNIQCQHQGAMKLLLWEAIRQFRNYGIRTVDFYGARINPPKGSKQEGINLMKKHLGASLSEGFMWKYPIRPWRALAYSLGVRLLRGGDIVDQEGKRLRGYSLRVEN